MRNKLIVFAFLFFSASTCFAGADDFNPNYNPADMEKRWDEDFRKCNKEALSAHPPPARIRVKKRGSRRTGSDAGVTASRGSFGSSTDNMTSPDSYGSRTRADIGGNDQYEKELTQANNARKAFAKTCMNVLGWTKPDK